MVANHQVCEHQAGVRVHAHQSRSDRRRSLRASSSVTSTTEIKVVCSPPLRSLLQVLRPRFERESGHKLAINIGSVLDLKRQIDAGDRFDVAVLTLELINALIKDGKIVSDTPVHIARSGLGVVVRAGSLLPDVGSVAAFRRALLDAESVMYASGSAATTHIDHVFEHLGITEHVRFKTKLRAPGGHIGKAIADGEAQLGLTHIPVILESRGAVLAGPFPADLQFYVHLAGGVSATSAKPEEAKALVRRLAASETTPVVEANGLERFRS